MVEATVPAAPTVIGVPLVPTPEAKVLEVETSNPTGGFIEIPAVNAVPETLND